MGRMINADEAARLLGVTSETVRELARRGKLPGYKVGSAWRFDVSELHRATRSAASADVRRAELSRDSEAI